MFCATVLYPYRAGASFDFDQYAQKLAPAYAAVLGDNCVRFEVRRGLSSSDGTPPPYLCVASFWVRSRDEFGDAMRDPRMGEVMVRIARFTEIEPLRQFDEVVAG